MPTIRSWQLSGVIVVCACASNPSMDILPANRFWQPSAATVLYHTRRSHLSVVSSWWWAWNCLKHVGQFIKRNKVLHNVASSWFCYPHWIKMHGQPHIKYIWSLYLLCIDGTNIINNWWYTTGWPPSKINICTYSEHTLRMCNTYCFPLQQLLPEHAFVFCYTYIACLVLGSLTCVQYFGQPHFCSPFRRASFSFSYFGAASLLFNFLDNLTLVQFYFYIPCNEKVLCRLKSSFYLDFSCKSSHICWSCRRCASQSGALSAFRNGGVRTP